MEKVIHAMEKIFHTVEVPDFFQRVDAPCRLAGKFFHTVVVPDFFQRVDAPCRLARQERKVGWLRVPPT
jgi:hypothetical protein